MNTDAAILYRTTINTAEQVKKAGIFNPMPLAEPCIFVFKNFQWDDSLKDISIKYFIKKYNYTESITKNSESKLLTKIIPERVKGTGIYFVKEYPLAIDFYQWNLYRTARSQGNYERAKEIKKNIILPEKEEIIRGMGFTLRQANYIASKIAKRRAREIAKKINYPLLEEIIDISK
jgi:hypothetical protein